jgi:superfamily II DNA or RNA helicase
VDALVAVRARLAAAIVGQHAPVMKALGTVTLHSHQVDAVRRLRDALRAHGGALLADAPGLGKTFVALALALDAGGAIVVAPAALRTQWLTAAARAGVKIHWHSLETLSRRPVRSNAPLLIIDEAHHLRNTATRRYGHAAALAVGKRVLLLTATPVHNRPADRHALLALFLGAQAGALGEHALARLIVRREADPSLLPARHATRWLCAPATPGIAAALRALPPPLPSADGRMAAALVRLTLAHAWSSSVGALDAAARRATHRAAALDDSLAVGRWPTRRELHAWVTSDESSQLAFAELVASPAAENTQGARAVLGRHVAALAALRTITARQVATDAAARAAALRLLLRRHRGATIIAFSRYAATVDALWRALQWDAGVVAISATRVRSAGGGMRRADVLRLLALPDASGGVTPLRLVLSTDLLGEGLDLRAASVVVHLDQPWTPALLDQREGRAARLTSPHASIAVYALRPPRAATQMLHLGVRLTAKRDAMHAGTAAGGAREALLTLVRPWILDGPARVRVAAARGEHDAWVAALRDAQGQIRVLASRAHDHDVVDDDARLLDILRTVRDAEPTRTTPHRVRAARRAIDRWLTAASASQLAGADDSAALARTTVARRLNAALRVSPLHQRAALQARIGAARSRLAAWRGAGVERALVQAAQQDSIDDVLGAVEQLGLSSAVPTVPDGRVQLLALLLIVPDA